MEEHSNSARMTQWQQSGGSSSTSKSTGSSCKVSGMATSRHPMAWRDTDGANPFLDATIGVVLTRRATRAQEVEEEKAKFEVHADAR